MYGLPGGDCLTECSMDNEKMPNCAAYRKNGFVFTNKDLAIRPCMYNAQDPPASGYQRICIVPPVFNNCSEFKHILETDNNGVYIHQENRLKLEHSFSGTKCYGDCITDNMEHDQIGNESCDSRCIEDFDKSVFIPAGAYRFPCTKNGIIYIFIHLKK